MHLAVVPFRTGVTLGRDVATGSVMHFRVQQPIVIKHGGHLLDGLWAVQRDDFNVLSFGTIGSRAGRQTSDRYTQRGPKPHFKKIRNNHNFDSLH